MSFTFLQQIEASFRILSISIGFYCDKVLFFPRSAVVNAIDFFPASLCEQCSATFMFYFHTKHRVRSADTS